MTPLDATPDRPRPKPQWLSQLWRHCSFLWWQRSEDLRRAHDALVGLHAAAGNHLTRRTWTSAIEVRRAYNASVFYCQLLTGRYVDDVRDLALYATYQCAEVLGPLAMEPSVTLYLRDEMERVVDAACTAMLDHLRALVTGNVRRASVLRRQGSATIFGVAAANVT